MKLLNPGAPKEERDGYKHLVEYQVKPDDLPGEYENFRVRETFPAGNLLCGDLVVNEITTGQLEMHPFPEWVVQLARLDTTATPVNVWCVVLDLDAKTIRKLGKADWKSRKEQAKALVKEANAGGIVAFEMGAGICVKVPANVPHYFVSASKSQEQVFPYCQVFEPAIDWESLKPFGKYEPTAYFKLPFELGIDGT